MREQTSTEQERWAIYCSRLRRAAHDLVKSATYMHGHLQEGADFVEVVVGRSTIVEMQNLLAEETGRLAEQEWACMDTLVAELYTLADFAHWKCYGQPRSPSGLIPSQTEVCEALHRVEAATRRSWGLDEERGEG